MVFALLRSLCCPRSARLLEVEHRDVELCESVDTPPPTADPDRLRAETPAALYAALKPLEGGKHPPMRLLKGSWIRQRAVEVREAKARGDTAAVRKLAITYRQEMPEEAFMTVEEVEELRKQIPDYERRLAVAGMSYCWETREHPDPEGNSLLALADALDKCYMEKQKSGMMDPYQRFPSDIGIFWDYPCIFQHPPGGKRTDEQDRLFKVRPRTPRPCRRCPCACCLQPLGPTLAPPLATVGAGSPRSDLRARGHDHLPAHRLGAPHPAVVLSERLDQLRVRSAPTHARTPLTTRLA